MVWVVLPSSVLIGAFLATLVPTQSKAFKYLLAFSGAFLFATLLTHLLPEVFESGNARMGWWILGGFALQLLLDYLSGGLEHGHFHHHGSVPVLALLGLLFHAFIEGMPLTADHHHTHGLPLLWAIALHKVPIALLVVAALRNAQVSHGLTLAAVLAFAVITPLGAQWQTTLQLDPTWTTRLLSLTTGLLLHVSTTILFESSQDHKFNSIKLVFVLLGMLIAAAINGA